LSRHRRIREKLVVGGLLVVAMVVLLSASSFLGIYSYRRLVRALSCRAAELPRAAELGACVGRLQLAQARGVAGDAAAGAAVHAELAATRAALDDYRRELDAVDIERVPFADRSQEHETAARIAICLETIEQRMRAAAVNRSPRDAPAAHQPLVAVGPDLERLDALAAALPSFLQERLHDLADEVRGRYRTLIGTTWVAASMAVLLLVAIGVLSYRWVFKPLRLLGHGSRRVAAGDFSYRIRLDTQDEMAELADALDAMTARFQEIRDDLDRQVQLRTREVIRGEQLASVGFLAAGVAHEINNPLASIAMCAESLEGRLGGPADDGEAQLTRRYLALIQTEAFRCKEITEKLLDFSRLGEVRRQPTAVMALVADVAEMLRHVGRFAGRTIEIEPGPDVLAMVNPQEIKQVVLNLLVNALDSIEDAGRVTVAARRSPLPETAHGGGEAVLTFTDDGCGMTDEVLEHMFEPFFTRRKSGQGTGLGLSIVHRIVTDHGGRIQVSSPGPGHGSTFRVTLPLADCGSGAAGRKSSPAPRSGRAA
jgi:signal transduction histidine kinase